MTDFDSNRLEELTWTEAEKALEEGTNTIIVAVGSIEQHGPHLPLVMDTLAGDELARRISERLEGSIAAPTIRPGCSGHHLNFPGTITIPPETLMNTIHAYGRSLAAHGFENIVLMPTHGGNFAPVNTVAPELARDINSNVLTLADLDNYMELMNEGLREANIDYEEPVVHAGATETAIVLAVTEGLVRKEELAVGYEGVVSIPRLLSEGFSAITKTGVLGDPREATVEAGERILERITNAYADRIKTELDAV